MDYNNQAYKAISKIGLNNWHYIDEKVLSLNKSINFFTGHSGSGKSTVIDALQIVLYANTDGRSFFNKAAADDSDRSLIEYLRGMINIGENGQAQYKRCRNFSSTIVLELQQTVTGEKECVGVIFDVDTASNEYSRLFFRHKGGLPLDHYRVGDRVISIAALRERLQRDFAKEDQFCTGSSERFRRNLYDVYLGGLDMEKFPRLFKRAIPFRMNIKLEDFVREYICMEQDIHIEEMQESVVLYGRMRRRIEAAMREIGELERIREEYRSYRGALGREQNYRYRRSRLEILQTGQMIEELQIRIREGKQDIAHAEQSLAELDARKAEWGQRYDEINRLIAGSGYADLEARLADLEEGLELLGRSERKWQELCGRLNRWEDEDTASNQILWDIRKFCKGAITGGELERLKKCLCEVRSDAERQRQEAAAEVRGLQKECAVLEQDLMELRLGRKSYPKELEGAAREIRRRLYEKLGKDVPVRILADLLDIRDEKWRNAIEGYLGSHKLALIVEPRYVRDAMEIYESLDEKRCSRVSLADTERILRQEHSAGPGTLAEEVEAGEPYVRALVNLLLGNVIKCRDVEELRNCRVGVTADCLLYQNFQLRRMNPENYTRWAYIGDKSMRERQRELQALLEELRKRQERFRETMEDAARRLALEYLPESAEEYLELFRDMGDRKKKASQRLKILARMEEIGTDTVNSLKEELAEVSSRSRELEKKADALKLSLHDRRNRMEADKGELIGRNEELLRKERELDKWETGEKNFVEFMAAAVPAGKAPDYRKLLRGAEEGMEETALRCRELKDRLVDVRSAYLKNHPGRDFSASGENNEEYDRLLEELACGSIRVYEEKAAEQARIAVEHFREDFIYKIRSAIKEAFQRRDELNRIIRGLNFGKDRYQFKITRNKGSFGEYYDMFMDEALSVDPSVLPDSVDRQMNLFSMVHEDKYGPLMNDLIGVFIPPENADARALEEARRNMEKYSDYRTYLSFEMEQIVEGEERLVIGLSRMIRKNSGGEGQNPLYVALLASFAQAYHINLTDRTARRPTIRLVVLDEAFSKMDAEKVASCIELIRSLGFQAIISATNDKIQNYLENVDKTFVYANPNKKSISIQEFEKKEFPGLAMEEGEDCG